MLLSSSAFKVTELRSRVFRKALDGRFGLGPQQKISLLSLLTETSEGVCMNCFFFFGGGFGWEGVFACFWFLAKN